MSFRGSFLLIVRLIPSFQLQSVSCGMDRMDFLPKLLDEKEIETLRDILSEDLLVHFSGDPDRYTPIFSGLTFNSLAFLLHYTQYLHDARTSHAQFTAFACSCRLSRFDEMITVDRHKVLLDYVNQDIDKGRRKLNKVLSNNRLFQGD